MKLTLILIVVLFCSVVAYGQATTGESKAKPSAEQELLSLITRWNEAELKGDATTISTLLADEFSFLGGSNKAEYLNLMKPDASLVIESATIENPKVRVYGAAAVVTTLNVFKLAKSGQPFAGKFLSLTVWIKRVGRWQCVNASQQPAKD